MTTLAPEFATPSTGAKFVRLHFRCRGIADMDTFSKSDPYIVLYVPSDSKLAFASNTHQSRVAPPATASVNGRPSAGSTKVRKSTIGSVSARGRELGRTEIIMNDLNPVFNTPIDVQFVFEARQLLTLVVYDDDGHTDDNQNDLCGFTQFQLSHVICSAEGKKEFPLTTGEGKTKGFVEVSFTDLTRSSRDSMQIVFKGSALASMGMCTSSSTYYILSCLQPNGNKVPLHKSEVVLGNSCPTWGMSPTIHTAGILGGDAKAKSLVFDLYAKGTFGDVSMGSFQCSVEELRAATGNLVGFTTRKAKNPSKAYADISVENMIYKQFPTFAQCLASGWQINMTLSIDFTGSNGHPKDVGSLHYMSATTPNQYVSAMMSVGDILMEYDTDKQIPVFGFGASFNGVTSHFFNVNGTENPYVSGIQGALDVYGRFLPTSVFSGPTNFAPTIRAITAEARRVEVERVYTILLIITDGEITDMRQTLDALVEADDAPLSIVIVGVGTACDFAMMVELDGDDANLVSSTGRVSRRDLVQFVPYRDFAHPKPREALAAEVLREIPDQFEEYLTLYSLRSEVSLQSALRTA